MKKKNIGIIAATILVVTFGSASLMLSMSHTFGAVQKNLSGVGEIATNVGKPVVDAEEKDEVKAELNLPKDERIKLYSDMENDVALDAVTKLSLVYEGQNVTIKDGLLTKEEAMDVATQIMNYIYGYVDETILSPYKIDKTKYEYKIQRQYRNQNQLDYGVFVLENDNIMCTIGITFKDEPVLTAFARDGFVDLYGDERVIPDEYLVENWCMTTEQRDTIYDEYLDESKHIIEEVLGLATIAEGYKNVDSNTYFKANDAWSNVNFGYVLNDGTYVNVFYNRVNQEWNGFLIAGYVEE